MIKSWPKRNPKKYLTHICGFCSDTKVTEQPQMKLLISLFFFFFITISAASPSFHVLTRFSYKKFILEENSGPWATSLLESAQAPGPAHDGGLPPNVLVLAAERTNRPDILNGFRRYRGGWDISNRHYWASVGFTGAAGFILGVLWFICFGLALVVHHCCRWRIRIKNLDSNHSLRICLILLLVFTCAAATGCILLSVGQDEFHREVLHTLKYVVNQSDYTVQTLRNVTGYLSLAKSINVSQVFLPSNDKDEIDKLNVELNTAANTLMEKTHVNSGKIRKVFNAMRSALIAMAAVMLLVALLGLLLSILGHQHAIYIFILSGWLLVAVTFILCGIFLILNNAISDTCMAMGDWVDNPQAETALSNILPCVDQRTTNKTLVQSKQVINQLVNVVNTVIYTYADSNPSPEDTFYYYNQSGALIPPLCSPFDSELHDHFCGPQEVSLANASRVWQNYTCVVSVAGLCTSVGRIPPDMYTQFVTAVNVSYALDHYTPILLSLQDCNFVRETFRAITSDYCPPLGHYLRVVVMGLGLISMDVMLCLVLWILYANHHQREDVFVKQSVRLKALNSTTAMATMATEITTHPN